MLTVLLTAAITEVTVVLQLTRPFMNWPNNLILKRKVFPLKACLLLSFFFVFCCFTRSKDKIISPLSRTNYCKQISSQLSSRPHIRCDHLLTPDLSSTLKSLVTTKLSL